MENFLTSLALSLILGLLASRVSKKIGLPAVTAYLVAGIILGPFVLGRLGIKGIGFTTESYIKQFDILSNLALGFIAFTIGNEFRIKDLEKMGKQAISVGILQAVITTVLVDVVLIVLHLIAPSLLSIQSAIVLGAIAAATAPAATLMVIKQYKATGPLTKLLLMVVALDDAVGLVLFSVSFGIASAIESGAISIITVLLEPILELVFSIILGTLLGVSLNFLERFFHSRSKRLSLVVAFVMLGVGLSMLTLNINGVKLSSSLLLTQMIAGTVFCNICSASDEIMDRLDRWTAPLLVLFFVLSGSGLDFSIFKNPLVLVIGIVYIISRSAGKIGGAYLSTRITHCSKEIQHYLGITLLPQAGVALGMAKEALVFSDGKIISNIVLFSVFVYELVGPMLTKISLERAGEINTSERKSSRVTNDSAS